MQGPLLKLLILGLVLAVAIRRITAYFKGFEQSVSPRPVVSWVSRPADIQKPWTKEPIEDPPLAETLIHGATVEYYEIFGDSSDQVQENLALRSRIMIGTADARLAYHLILYKGDPADGVCGYSTAHVQAELTTLVPRWITMPKATDEAKQWWGYQIRELARDEQDGIDTALHEADLAASEIQRANCATGDATYAQLNQRLAAVHRQDASTGKRIDVQFEMPGAVVDRTPASPQTDLRQLASKSAAQRPSSPLDQMELISLDGAQVPMQTQKGRVLFLNFFATWCGPCRSEMPSLASLFAKMKGRNIFFACVSNETANVIQFYASKTHLGLPFYRRGSDGLQSLTVPALPTTYIISKNGGVALSRVGAMSWDTPEIVKFLNDLENE